MGTLGQDVVDKVSGPVWEDLREKFMELSEALLSVSPLTTGRLTTIYVKYAIKDESTSPVYAVVWIKNSKKWVVGLALPDGVDAPELGPPPPQRTYAGLTKYFTITPQDTLPTNLSVWAKLAHDRVALKEQGTHGS